MDADLMIRTVRGQLGAAVLERLRFVTIEHRPEPTADDVARGAGPTHRGYFYGFPIDRPEGETTELPDEEPPVGTIVLFTDRIQPLDLEGVAVVLLHEIGHALGYDHDVLEELGLA